MGEVVATTDWRSQAQRSAARRRRLRRRLTPWAAGLTATVGAASGLAWVVHGGAVPTRTSRPRASQALRNDESTLRDLERQTLAEQRAIAAIGGATSIKLPPLPPPPAHASTGASGVP